MKILLTGATGLLGNHIASVLLQRKYSVSALVRSVERAQTILDSRINFIQGRLEEVDGFKGSMEGHDAMIHAAAVYGEYYRNGKEGVLTDINVKGTMTLFEAAWEAGINNIVYISSAAVLDTKKDTEADETAPYSNTIEPYFKSKVMAEKAVMNFIQEHPGIRIVTLLPTVMIGPGDRGPTPNGNFIINFLKGRFKFIIPGSNRIVDARDVAKAAVNAIKSGTGGERYIIGGRKYNYDEIFRELADITGRTFLEKKISPGRLLLIAKVVTLLHKIIGKPSPLKPDIAKRLQKNFWYNSSKAKKELCVTFRPLRETLSDTVIWFQENHYV